MIYSLLSHHKQLSFGELIKDDDHFVLQIRFNSNTSKCPQCDQLSKREHSRYLRHLLDLPWACIPVHLELTVRKFFCDNAGCSRKIFAEKTPAFVKPYGRRTQRLDEMLQKIGWKTGGNPTAEIARIIGAPVSPSTILRLLHACEVEACSSPRVIGVDDWAFRKGQRYGTIIVDLEKGQVIDLLPDRETETLKVWLKNHPDIEVISRDRASCYSLAATKGAPNAIQVADRWHLLKNLGDALKRMLEKYNKELRQVALSIAKKERESELTIQIENEKKQADKDGQTTAPSKRHLMFDQVKELIKQGCSIRSVAKQLKMSRVTIRKYIQYDSYPERARPPVSLSGVIPYHSYLKQRCKEGQTNGIRLWEEITAQGYRGSTSSVYRILIHLLDRKTSTQNQPAPLPVRAWSTRKISLLMCKQSQKLNEDESKYLQIFYSSCPEAKNAGALALYFKDIMDQLNGSELDKWMQQVNESKIGSLMNFVKGIRHDYKAVKAGLTLQWSNGQVEGQVNRLKNIKRRMYGKASFCLLRKCVLSDTS